MIPARSLLLLGAALLSAAPALACFGVRLRVAVIQSPEASLATYVTGFFVEEKTGIEPDFVAVGKDPADPIRRGYADLALVPESVAPPEGLAVRPAGQIPGLGACRFWIRPEVLDDLRFFTVDRALGLLPAFFASDAYGEASRSAEPSRKAARRVVLLAP